MKLLIIDDEDLTREGLLNAIHWDKLGISKIYDADDGINGLNLAYTHKPEIILSDVRMPRLGGIDMAVKIRKHLPDCSIIFMSGYSDKEYLKAAIKLKAVSYVEKPIDTKEIEAAVREAVATQLKHQKDKESSHHQHNYARNKLALQLTAPRSGVQYTNSLKSLGFPTHQYVSYATIIIQFQLPVSDIFEPELQQMYRKLKIIIHSLKMDYLPGVKQDKYLIIHLFSKNSRCESTFIELSDKLIHCINEKYVFYIAVGDTVKSLDNLYESYKTAVILLQSAFFYPYNSVIRRTEKELSAASELAPEQFLEALNSRDKKGASEIIANVYELLKMNQSLLPSQAIELYYGFLASLKQAAAAQRIILASDENLNLIDYMSKGKNLSEINSFLLAGLNRFFQILDESSQDSATVYAVKEYISQNYHNCYLSIKDISEHVYLSSSYLCTIFKTETGVTLNQFLTSYRMEKAKRMLLDPRYKIADISAKVGYRDGNYFGKSFRKLVGLSPSEYRELYLK